MVITRIMPGAKKIVWPSFFNSVRNWVQTAFIIRPHFDREFSLQNFDRGARQAFLSVSERLSEGDAESLKGLVTDEVQDGLKKAAATWTAEDRQKFKLDESDIYLSFIYQVGIIMPEKTSEQRWVEIMAVFHTLRGFRELQKQNIDVQDLQKNTDRFLFGNFRFSRNFSKGINLDESEWIINYINYFTPENESKI
ncbi:m-AAA protease-interacting protein 1, mitochondrial-like [Paramacrobiotus metropolitanus]|uniref:m-AAA protease-interacting protein 1, mitochondrial-like n=1 Tax=Paramacrobiotus metropolitanus TaxID=2943436 RepID=UPI00244610B8|nr:m-AAA protease-interacting protein 1, mitochondrial-like [Paramacrobiotus metropolitanus]